MKFLSLLITAILFTGYVNAQHSSSPKGHVNLGVKGGLNVYNVYNSNDTKDDFRLGYHFGLLGHIHLGNHFAMQPELLYSSQGSKYSNGGETINNELSYINVPLLFQYMFDQGFRIQAGPQVGFLVGAKSKNNNITTNIKDNFEPIDWTLALGMSYIFPPTGFGVDARFNLGLSDISKYSDLKTTNRGFQLGLFYIFKYNHIVN